MSPKNHKCRFFVKCAPPTMPIGPQPRCESPGGESRPVGAAPPRPTYEGEEAHRQRARMLKNVVRKVEPVAMAAPLCQEKNEPAMPRLSAGWCGYNPNQSNG